MSISNSSISLSVTTTGTIIVRPDGVLGSVRRSIRDHHITTTPTTRHHNYPTIHIKTTTSKQNTKYKQNTKEESWQQRSTTLRGTFGRQQAIVGNSKRNRTIADHSDEPMVGGMVVTDSN